LHGKKFKNENSGKLKNKNPEKLKNPTVKIL